MLLHQTPRICLQGSTASDSGPGSRTAPPLLHGEHMAGPTADRSVRPRCSPQSSLQERPPPCRETQEKDVEENAQLTLCTVHKIKLYSQTCTLVQSNARNVDGRSNSDNLGVQRGIERGVWRWGVLILNHSSTLSLFFLIESLKEKKNYDLVQLLINSIKTNTGT